MTLKINGDVLGLMNNKHKHFLTPKSQSSTILNRVIDFCFLGGEMTKSSYLGKTRKCGSYQVLS